METDWIQLRSALVDGNAKDRRQSLLIIKDSVIGSNRQKGALISHDIVPIILKICNETNEYDKTNALVVLGSLAKGTPGQVQLLVNTYNVMPILINEITSENNDRKCVEICLSTMCTIYEQPYAHVDEFFKNGKTLSVFLSLAAPESSLKTQICVTSILVALCQSYEDQILLLHAGTIHLLARMICFNNKHIQIPALRCLSSMCYSNRQVADNVCVTSFMGRSLPDILNSLMSRLFTPEIQITAARCLTYIYRSGTLLSTDNRILHKTLPSLARLCSDNFNQSIRGESADILAYLIEVDSELQRTAAISNHLLKSLSQLLQISDSIIKNAALRCFASLGANDETIRKRIMDCTGLIDSIIDGVNDDNDEVKLAAVKCLHSLSRSVQQLRTTFQDHNVWKPLLDIISNQTSIEYLIATSSTICNLVLEFSPSKEPLVNSGIIEKFCQFTKHSEPEIRVNGLWGLMNASYQADERLKMEIINTIGMRRLLELISDTDSTVVLKTLGLIRNLMSSSYYIDFIMEANSVEVLDAIIMLLDSNHLPDIKEQVLCIVGNIAAEAGNIEYIINDERIMTHLDKYLFHSEQKLQEGALFVVHNIVYRRDIWKSGNYSRLAELDVIKNIKELYRKASGNKISYEDYVLRTIMEIVSHCKIFCPEQ
ncbi:armadillo repeat-containing protein 8-like [Teleopsis dalmanni]|uniref:armadillo repeat-containing protein 8-like n=1 Tax=Teleopsis dalmanni TaxID=139649 RepID=UPI0018CFBC0A|nr:armadillo repeat-containing protein 8-like [Teleopsis dalmanni]